MKKRSFRPLFAGTCLLMLLGPYSGLSQNTPRDSTQMTVACSAEKPIIIQGDVVKLSSFLGLADTTKLKYEWITTGGNIIAQSSKVTWDLSKETPNAYFATVQISRNNSKPLKCKVTVIVAPREDVKGDSGVSHAGRSFLIKGYNEAQNYGLYSYLLFKSPPNDVLRPKYLATLKACMELLPRINQFPDYGLKPAELNLMYIPLNRKLEKGKDRVPEWMLSNYDYIRSGIILKKLSHELSDGPYLLATLAPASTRADLSEKYLLINLTIVPPELAYSWVKEFLNQAAQVHHWDEEASVTFALQLRTALSNLAAGFKPVTESIDTLVDWVKK